MTDKAEMAKNADKSYETFDEYLATVEEPIKALYEEHTSGLKTALEKEREERKELNSKVKQLHEKAEKGSELEKQLSETLERLEQAERNYEATQKRIKFAEQASMPEIGCTNPKEAYALAITENLFDKNGEPEWKAIQETAPQLFRKTTTDAGKTGSRTGNDINALIRQKAGLQ
jgi:DNA repair exonuclease SbcCD ATPase subunit